MTVINMPNKSKGTLHSKQGLSSALKYITDKRNGNFKRKKAKRK